MLKPQAYQEIFRQKNKQKAIQLAKRFFILQSPPLIIENSFNYTKGHSYYMSQTKSNLLKKNTQKFTGGFLEKTQRSHYKSKINQNQFQTMLNFDKSKQQKKQMVKDVTKQYVNDVLLGNQNKLIKNIHKQSYQLPQIITTKPQICHLTKTSSAPKSSHRKYDQIMRNIEKIKEQTKKIRSFNLPNLQQTKSTHDSDRKKSYNQIINNSVSGKQTFKKYSITDSQRIEIYRQSNISIEVQNALLQKRRTSKTSLKSLSPPKIVQKGYLAYDQKSFKFWNNNLKNLLQKLKFETNVHIPGITAKYYFVLDAINLLPIAQKNSNQKVQIASLTKIMTCFLCILICKKYQVDMDQFVIRVSDKAAQMPGTSAQLRCGDLISLKQLLYGLMLPSGNDASVAIAENVGKIIQRYKKKYHQKSGYEVFILHMNYFAKQLGLNQQYLNSSGLALNPNFSTARQITILSALAIKNQLFRQIVNTKQYELQIRNQRFGLLRKAIWKNTNKLLWKQWEGIKTGTTETAGHCLMSKKGKYIICVLSCQTLQKRFAQSNKIYDYLNKHFLEQEIIIKNQLKLISNNKKQIS